MAEYTAPMTAHERAIQSCTEIADKYNGDFDTVTGMPPVTYTEMRLLQLIIKLENRVHQLEEQLKGENTDDE